MDRIEGETIPRRILRDDRVRSGAAAPRAQSGDDRRAHPRGRHRRAPAAAGDGRRASRSTQYRALPRRASASRTRRSSSACAGSTSTSADRPAPPVLVHGDFRNGNFIVGADGIRAVLDWELAHLGDPVEDLGWLCVKSWRFGNADQIVRRVRLARRAARRVRRRAAAPRSTRTPCGSGSCSAR